MCIYRKYLILSYTHMLKIGIEVQMGDFHSGSIVKFSDFQPQLEIWENMEPGAHGCETRLPNKAHFE